MLKSINFEGKNVVAGKVDIATKMNQFVIRNHELELLVSRNRETVKVLESEHAEEISAWDLKPEEIRTCTGLDSVDKERFIKACEEYHELNDILSELPTKDEFNALPDVDKTFLTVIAHSNMRGVKLPKECLPENMADMIADFYKTGNLKNFRESMRSTFNRLFQEDGELFYGVRFARADFDSDELRTCLAAFRGDAGRKFDKKTESFGSYEWRIKDGITSVQQMAVTNLFAIVICSRMDHYDRVSEMAKKDGEKTSK